METIRNEERTNIIPDIIGAAEDGRHWLTFSDGQGNRHHFEISAAVFALFDSFELDDLSYHHFATILPYTCFFV